MTTRKIVLPDAADSEIYRNAFLAIRGSLSSRQLEILEKLFVAPDRALSASQIAELLHLHSHAPVNRAFGDIGKKLADIMGWHPPKRENGSYRWWTMLADGEQSSRDRKWMWVLRPAVREALQAADFFATDSRDFPDVVSQPLFEGAAKSIRVNAYERNEIARRRCIEHYGTACSACSADLGSVYGPKAHGLIHVHHLRPLHELSEEYEVDPISDLRPVCPSCHAVIHRRDPPFTLSEIREMLAAQKKNK